MAYAHGAGVAATGQGMMPPERAKTTLQTVSEVLGKIPDMGTEHEESHEGQHEHHHEH